jgi:hypothetical protein
MFGVPSLIFGVATGGFAMLIANAVEKRAGSVTHG